MLNPQLFFRVILVINWSKCKLRRLLNGCKMLLDDEIFLYDNTDTRNHSASEFPDNGKSYMLVTFTRNA